jgi:hypothetical protein
MDVKKIKCQVHLVKTETGENCIIILNGDRIRQCYYVNNILTQDYIKNFINGESKHIYITSDDEIKDGDYVMWGIRVCKYSYDKENNTHDILVIETGEKFPFSTTDYIDTIIATTDKSLNLPKPQTQFIEKFVTEYNKGNEIKEVLVDYTEIFIDPIGNECELDLDDCRTEYKLKIDSHNCITITTMKDSWTREEVEMEIRTSHVNIHGASCYLMSQVDDYIKKNL